MRQAARGFESGHHAKDGAGETPSATDAVGAGCKPAAIGNPAPPKGEGRGGGALRALLAGLAARVMSWSERARQRRQLATLDDRNLKDIGLTRADVTSEADKPFWRA